MSYRQSWIAAAACLLPLLAVAAVPPAPSSQGGREEGRSLLDVVGIVTEVAEAKGADGLVCVEATVKTDARGTLRIRLAPREILDRDGFAVRVRDAVRARVFGDEDPHGVHRITNETTGRSLRLRCLHGDPLWNAPPQRRGRERWRGGTF